MSKFTGMGVALITPFDSRGKVDYNALSKLVTYHLEHTTDYLVLLGTTAETPTLSSREKQQIVEHVISLTQGKIPLVMGFGGNNTQQLISQLQKCPPPQGIDAILSVTPYYNKPSQEGLYLHFSAISKASPVPIILYNIPSRTGVNMNAHTTLSLDRDHKNIIAIKEASGNLEQISSIIKHKSSKFSVISGDDALATSMIKLGATGVISVIGNAFAEQYRKIIHLALDGKYSQAQEECQHLALLFDLLFIDGNPAGIKYILYHLGYIQNQLRLPLTPIKENTQKKINELLKTHNPLKHK